jgi:hypothetical protein
VPRPRTIRARPQAAPLDFALADRLLEQAANHLESASITGVDREGRRITHGAGHHIAYLEEAKRLLGPTHDDLLTRVEAARLTRNRAEYQARQVTETELTDLHGAAHALLAAARAHVSMLRRT